MSATWWDRWRPKTPAEVIVQFGPCLVSLGATWWWQGRIDSGDAMWPRTSFSMPLMIIMANLAGFSAILFTVLAASMRERTSAVLRAMRYLGRGSLTGAVACASGTFVASEPSGFTVVGYLGLPLIDKDGKPHPVVYLWMLLQIWAFLAFVRSIWAVSRIAELA